jgi:hypothetical protein
MIIENVPTLKIHKLTQEQYDRELAAGNLDENALYLTPGGDGGNAFGDEITQEEIIAMFDQETV